MQQMHSSGDSSCVRALHVVCRRGYRSAGLWHTVKTPLPCYMQTLWHALKTNPFCMTQPAEERVVNYSSSFRQQDAADADAAAPLLIADDPMATPGEGV